MNFEFSQFDSYEPISIKTNLTGAKMSSRKRGFEQKCLRAIVIFRAYLTPNLNK